MMKEIAIAESLALVSRAKFVLLGTNAEDGYPNIKAMFKMENEGLNKIYLSTNTSSKRIQQIQKNSKGCLYFLDTEKMCGLMLLGEITIHQDENHRRQLWREGFERYYRLGVNDPDYTVLVFHTKRGNYYHGLENVDFEL